MTWAGDPKADVCDGDNVYAEVVKEWAEITGGAFAPTDIHEKWHSVIGPIEVSFLVNGQPNLITPTHRDDWIDLKIVAQLNRILEASGKRFNYVVDGNFCLLLFLSPEMELRLRQERAFPFALP